MTNITNKYITDYIRGTIPKKDELLEKIQVYAYKNKVPIIEPEVAQLLTVMIKIAKPKEVLEVGTAIGYSALIMASSFPQCNVTTIERNERMIEKAELNISKSDFKDKIKIINGDANEILPELSGMFDLIFLDAAKGQYIEFFKESSKLLKKGGIIISDNVLYKGMVASDELVIRRKKTIVKRLRNYLEYINQIEGYTSSILPVGDGVAITYKD